MHPLSCIEDQARVFARIPANMAYVLKQPQTISSYTSHIVWLVSQGPALYS